MKQIRWNKQLSLGHWSDLEDIAFTGKALIKGKKHANVIHFSLVLHMLNGELTHEFNAPYKYKELIYPNTNSPTFSLSFILFGHEKSSIKLFGVIS